MVLKESILDRHLMFLGPRCPKKHGPSCLGPRFYWAEWSGPSCLLVELSVNRPGIISGTVFMRLVE